MDEFPRLPMLYVDIKFSATPVDFGPKLSEYIIRNYKEDVANYRVEIETLNSLREAAVKPSADLTSLSAAKRYYAQLQFLKSRFPLHENGAAAITFAWLEKYADIPLSVSAEDVDFELACVLHNIGAVHSQLGANDSRLSLEGMKEACTHFQCSSWTFEQLANEFKGQSRYTPDFDPGLFNWEKLLMLAQAQECILEKSLIDSRKCVVIGKVAVEVVSLYKRCAAQLEEQTIVDIVGISQFKIWKRFVQVKIGYYSALMNLHIGMQCENEKKWGERLAYYLAAQADINSASRLLKKATDSFSSAVQFVSEIIESRVSVAQKENDFVYHEKVPDYGQLPPWKGVTLVKPIAFDISDPNISGPEIFQKLIPIHIHKWSSIYSEEKAKILRTINAKAEECNAAISKFLNTLKLNDALNKKSFSLPEELVECCAAFQADRDNVYNLMSMLDGFKEVAKCLGCDLGKLQARASTISVDFGRLKAIKEDELRAVESRLATVKVDCRKCFAALEEARNADEKIEKALFSSMKDLDSLKLPIDKLTAELQGNVVDMRELSEAQELIRLLAKADEMVNQRTTLMETLKMDMMEDDISKALLALPDDDYEDLFQVELRKHDKVINLLKQNFAAQENIMGAITEANARFVPFRLEAENAEKQSKERIMSLITSYNTFVELRKKAGEGVHFYDALKKKALSLKKVVDLMEEKYNKALKRQENGDADRSQDNQGQEIGHQPAGPVGHTRGIPANIHGPPCAESAMRTVPAPVTGRPVPLVINTGQSSPLKVVRPVFHAERTPAPHPAFFQQVPFPSGFISNRLPYFRASPNFFDPRSFGASEQAPHFTPQSNYATLYYPYKPWCPTAAPVGHQFYGCPNQPYAGPIQLEPNSLHRAKMPGSFSSSKVTTANANVTVVTANGDGRAPESMSNPIESIMNDIEGTVAADLPPAILPIPSTATAAKNAGSLKAGDSDRSTTAASYEADRTTLKEAVAPADKESEAPVSSDQPSSDRSQQTATGRARCSDYSEAVMDNREKIAQAAVRFEKLVQSFDRRSLNGPTLLELTWKEIMEHCEAETRKHTISIAKCYPFKNRVPDLLPYDDSRVVLQSAKDDYINASFVNSICERGPNFIITQAPTAQSVEDFWLMIFEQNVELICSIMSSSEVKGKRIWPEESEPIKTSSLCVTVVSKKNHVCYSERLVSILNQKASQVRCVVHLQYAAWIHGSALKDLSGFVDFLTGARSHYIVQRLRSHPICVQSLYGSSRSGVFCLTFSAIQEIMSSGLVPQVNLMVEKVWACRKKCIADAQDLQLCHVLISSFLERLVTKMSATVPESDKHSTDHGRKVTNSFDPFAELSEPFTSTWAAVTPLERNHEVKEQSAVEQNASLPPKQGATTGVVPVNPRSSNRLLELTDPEKFTLDLPPTSRRRTTKQDFLAAQSAARRYIGSSEESVRSSGTPSDK